MIYWPCWLLLSSSLLYPLIKLFKYFFLSNTISFNQIKPRNMILKNFFFSYHTWHNSVNSNNFELWTLHSRFHLLFLERTLFLHIIKRTRETLLAGYITYLGVGLGSITFVFLFCFFLSKIQGRFKLTWPTSVFNPGIYCKPFKSLSNFSFVQKRLTEKGQ